MAQAERHRRGRRMAAIGEGMKGFWRALSLAGVIGVSGCVSVGLDIFSLQVPRNGYQRLRDVAYGPLPEQKLDIYVPDRPPGAGTGPLPVILFLPGGRWANA